MGKNNRERVFSFFNGGADSFFFPAVQPRKGFVQNDCIPGVPEKAGQVQTFEFSP